MLSRWMQIVNQILTGIILGTENALTLKYNHQKSLTCIACNYPSNEFTKLPKFTDKLSMPKCAGQSLEEFKHSSISPLAHRKHFNLWENVLLVDSPLGYSLQWEPCLSPLPWAGHQRGSMSTKRRISSCGRKKGKTYNLPNKEKKNVGKRINIWS